MNNSQFPVLEASLNRAEFRWKWLRFLKCTSILGVLFCLIFVLFGAAIVFGGIRSHSLVIGITVVLVLCGLLTWVASVIAILISTPERRWLAAALERVERRFFDRLNTLLFLEARHGEPEADAFASQIARQTQGVLAEKPLPSAFPAKASYAWFGVFLCVVFACAVLNHLYSPWSVVKAASTSKPAHTVPDKPLELALPETNNLEPEQPWGEVRINQPGTDLQVTKLDVVPLQIEAAATQPLRAVGWFTAINGGQETHHALPAPSEPRYAVYQPTLYLNELNLTDWDVLTYYAKADTEKQDSFASEVYFLEVRPFREDMLRLPGGANGEAYRGLNEISWLINRQEHVIRQTHQHILRPPEQENVRVQDRKKLEQAEADLRDSTQHLYGKIVAAIEDKPAGLNLEALAKAKESFEAATQSLQKGEMLDAQSQERSALAELVAARKMFQTAMSQVASSMQESNHELLPRANSAQKVGQMTEFRDEAKAAQDFVGKTLAEQKNIERQSCAALRDQFPRLANQEQSLKRSLHDFNGEHPSIFKGAEAEVLQAEQAMSQATVALQEYRDEAKAVTRQATRELETLARTVETQSLERQLGDAYKLKQMLDEQIRTLSQCATPGSKVSDTELQRAARDARETINQLKNTSELEPTRDAFGPPLREALTGQSKVNLDARLMQLKQTQDEISRQERAAEARAELDKVSKAFEASQPQSFRAAQQSDSLNPNEAEALDNAVAELESLVKQLERGSRITPEDQARQGRQALWNLQTGIRSQSGDNQEGNQLLSQLGQMLKTETGLEPGDLRNLIDALQRFSTEASGQLARAGDNAEITNIDPSRLPPAYRGRIQRYFQRLSEQ